MTSDSSQTSVAADRSGAVGPAFDRLFPLVWLGLYLLLPTSGWSDIFFTGWNDQIRDLAALRSVLETGESQTIADNAIGPGYIALASWIHQLTGLSPESSLVALNRASYAVTVAAGMLLVGLFVRRAVGASAPASIAAQFVFMALAFAAGTWYWSDVPWSHFVAACLGVLVYATRSALPMRPTLAAAIVGALFALLVLTRSFEAVSLLLAWVLVLALFGALRLVTWARPRLALIGAGLAAFLATSVAVHVATGLREPFFLYGGRLDRQSGDLPPEEIAVTPTLSPAFVPAKLVQLFVEPCYYSLCRLSDYAGTDERLTGTLVGASGQERLWRLPLSIQLPSLVLLPLAIVAVAGLVLWLVRRRAVGEPHRRDVRLLAEMTVAATGIVVGYSASTLTGSSHLRYGFARDFLLPAALSGVVAVSLAAAGLWLALARRGGIGLPAARARISPETGMVAGALVVSVAIGLAVWGGRTYGLPRIESRQLGSVQYAASCEDRRCEVAIRARTVRAEPLAIPERSTLTFGCGSDAPRFTIYSERPTSGVTLPGPCADPRLVAAWPTVMGLPPGTREHRAVDVVDLP